MVEDIEERLRRLENKVERLDEAIIPKMVCDECGRLLTIHEEYKDGAVYDSGSHAQCYRCGTFRDVVEPKKTRGEWVKMKGKIHIK